MKATATKTLKPDNEWQVQTAKARFSELFRRARTEGPQRITRQGKEAVVMLPAEQYDKLTRREPKKETLFEFLQRSPLRGVKLDLARNKDTGRDIKL